MYASGIDWEKTKGAVWRVHAKCLKPLVDFSALPLEKLLGIDRQKAALIQNTEQFIAGAAANHVLLWGSRGTGKSSLIRALLGHYFAAGLRVIEIPRESLSWLPEISDELRLLPYRFIIFCDDLSFETGESSYKGLKSIMEGSLETPPENIRVYATSNRRHLVPEYMTDNQQVSVGERGELHLSDSVEERISLADRFGLSLSFYQGSLDDYLVLVESYFKGYEGDWTLLMQEARRFAQARASYSGRTAQQFFNFKGLSL
ncbi:MAG: ATP-binding protein [Pseudomonadaceae bacterium]|nr:ATP-binding protein [Pseudomonadaceae bacterium]